MCIPFPTNQEETHFVFAHACLDLDLLLSSHLLDFTLHTLNAATAATKSGERPSCVGHAAGLHVTYQVFFVLCFPL